jgi:NADPH-dependent 2,4-dienoyl-CoA reductase/sulfur reductase-like enzyme/nitrite reductase/ring-hydroxylating ferredoxin subunit
MGDAAKVSGPDFLQGVAVAVAAAELADGQPLLGHIGDESVMLVRRGDELYAVGATCTHYSGPLAQGLVVGETVRCPWHHACFDLKTGAAVKAPALSPIACYDVTIADGLVRVGAKKPAPALPPAPTGAPESIVIVGAGAAGQACAGELRARGYRGRLVLIGAEESLPVDRPNLSKDYLAGSAPEDWLPLKPLSWYAESGIELQLGSRVVALDVKTRHVTLENGRSYDFERLLLATGAEPRRLKIPGGERAHVLRSLADSRAIIALANPGQRAVVVGASFIGLEVAAALRARQVDVTVVAPVGPPLARVLGPELGAYLQSLHESHGVRFRLAQPVALGDDGVTLDDGSMLPCDFVVAGIGVRPAIALGELAGLALDDGILVDAQLETSVPGIFAAGDSARYLDKAGVRRRVEHWVVAQRMGQAAARNLLGAGEPFRDVPFFWSQHYDVGINYVGAGAGWDRVVLDGNPADNDCSVRYFRGEELLAVATIYRDAESLAAERQLELT